MMKLHERGVLPQSNIYFHTPKEHDRKMLLTVSSSGHYFCDETYRVVRNNYDGHPAHNGFPNNYGSYLVLFIKSGNAYVYQNGGKILLCENDVFLLDCYHSHTYGAQAGSKLEMVWVHFDGTMVRDYFKTNAKGINCSVLKFLPPARFQIIQNNLYNVYEKFDKKKGVNDILNNKYLVIVMTEFMLGNSPVPEEDNPWDDLLSYISENIQKPLKSEDLAERMALSPFHFIRRFKKEIGYTPHQYVMMARIGTANHLLKRTTLPIKEIAQTCGFASEGSFCNTFKNLMGVWPEAYRGNT
jgi:AraC-like DNA-binding protein